MFIGHFGVGLGAKKAAPKVSLGTLFLAAQFLDLLWPTFILLGWEHVRIEPGITVMNPLNFTDYPISHSLLMACVWGMALGFIYFFIHRDYKQGIILVLCVVSHWILDLLVHRPDLPLYPGNTMLVGFGLWNYRIVEIVTETSIFIVGLVFYLQTTTPRNNIGKYGFWALIILLVATHVLNLSGTPPPNVTVIAWAAETQWLFVIWAFWVDKNRSVKVQNPAKDTI